VLLAGLGAPVGLAILLSQMDESVTRLGRLRELGYPVLGAVSMVRSSLGRARLYIQGLSLAASVLLLVVAYGGIATGVVNHYKVFFTWIIAHT
jgi:hypothetical protein